MNRAKKHFIATLWALFGVSFVILIIIEMNKEDFTPPKKEPIHQISVAPPPKPKPKPKPRPKPKPKPKPKPAKSAPKPNLNAPLSGIDTGLEQFRVDDLVSQKSLLKDIDKSNMVMTANSVDNPPVPISRTPIPYPKKAKQKGITGYVVVNLLIDQNGNIVRAKIVQSTPPGVFDDAVLSAIRSWKFKPAIYKGQPVKVWAKQKIRFAFD